MSENILQEIEDLIYGTEETDWEGVDFFNCDEFKQIEKVYAHGGEDEYEDTYFRWVFKYKGKFYSVEGNAASYGTNGFEWDTLKEVFPVEKTVTVYE